MTATELDLDPTLTATPEHLLHATGDPGLIEWARAEGKPITAIAWPRDARASRASFGVHARAEWGTT